MRARAQLSYARHRHVALVAGVGRRRSHAGRKARRGDHTGAHDPAITKRQVIPGDIPGERTRARRRRPEREDRQRGQSS